MWAEGGLCWLIKPDYSRGGDGAALGDSWDQVPTGWQQGCPVPSVSLSLPEGFLFSECRLLLPAGDIAVPQRPAVILRTS